MSSEIQSLTRNMRKCLHEWLLQCTILCVSVILIPYSSCCVVVFTCFVQTGAERQWQVSSASAYCASVLCTVLYLDSSLTRYPSLFCWWRYGCSVRPEETRSVHKWIAHWVPFAYCIVNSVTLIMSSIASLSFVSLSLPTSSGRTLYGYVHIIILRAAALHYITCTLHHVRLSH